MGEFPPPPIDVSTKLEDILEHRNVWLTCSRTLRQSTSRETLLLLFPLKLTSLPLLNFKACFSIQKVNHQQRILQHEQYLDFTLYCKPKPQNKKVFRLPF